MRVRRQVRNVVSVLATKGPHPVRFGRRGGEIPGNAPSSTLSEDELSRFLEEIMDTAGSAGIHEDDLRGRVREFEITVVHAGTRGTRKRDEVVVRWDEDKKALYWRLRDPYSSHVAAPGRWRGPAHRSRRTCVASGDPVSVGANQQVMPG